MPTLDTSPPGTEGVVQQCWSREGWRSPSLQMAPLFLLYTAHTQLPIEDPAGEITISFCNFFLWKTESKINRSAEVIFLIRKVTARIAQKKMSSS